MPLNHSRYLGQNPPDHGEGQSGQGKDNLARRGLTRARASPVRLRSAPGAALHKTEDISLNARTAKTEGYLLASDIMSDNQTKLGVAPNVGGLLCNVPCCIGFIVSIVALVIEKENKFVRFHAFQSLLLHGAAFVSLFAIQVLSIVVSMVMGALGGLIGLIGMPLGLGFLIAQVVLMMKANNNEEFKLPVIGDMASQWV